MQSSISIGAKINHQLEGEVCTNKHVNRSKDKRAKELDICFLQQNWIVFNGILEQIQDKLEMASARIQDGETSALSYPVAMCVVCMCIVHMCVEAKC